MSCVLNSSPFQFMVEDEISQFKNYLIISDLRCEFEFTSDWSRFQVSSPLPPCNTLMCSFIEKISEHRAGNCHVLDWRIFHATIDQSSDCFTTWLVLLFFTFLLGLPFTS